MIEQLGFVCGAAILHSECQELVNVRHWSLTQYAVQVGDLQWVRIPPGQSVARPEAIRAAQGTSSLRQQVVNA